MTPAACLRCSNTGAIGERYCGCPAAAALRARLDADAKERPHAFVRGKFQRGERGGQWPEETCDVCGRDPRNAVHHRPASDTNPEVN